MENCAVCRKYLSTIGLQEQGMCNDCDDRTSEIAKSFNNEFECCDNCDLPDACSDFGCAIKQGLRTPNESSGVYGRPDWIEDI